MDRIQQLKSCIEELINAAPEESLPYEILLRGTSLQEELVRLLRTEDDISKPKNKAAITRLKTQLHLFQELLNVQKATRQIHQTIAPVAELKPQQGYRGMGIKNLIQKRKNGTDSIEQN